MARWGEGKATVVFKEGFSVTDDPQFVDRCIRIANELDRRVDSVSIKFEALERFGDLNEPRLKAQLAWRGEVFAEVSRETWHDPRNLGFQGCVKTEEEVQEESFAVLRDHARRIVSEHKRRVQYAERLIEILQ